MSEICSQIVLAWLSLSSLGNGSKKKWYGESSFPPDGKWVSTADKMVQRFKETGHPVFESISALSHGILKRKKGKQAIHFNGDSSITELLFRIIHSAHQLSICGAVASWCEQFGWTEEEKGQEKLKTQTLLGTLKILNLLR